MEPGLAVVCAVQVLLLLLVIVALVMYLSRNLRCRSRTEVDAKTVLVLSCDSLPGYHIAKYLDQLGLRVIAACTDSNSSLALRLHTDVSPKLRLISWNAHAETDVATALKLVQESIPPAEKGLWALVLPVAAHRSVQAKFESQAWSEWQQALHTNVVEPLRAIHACIPLLKRRQGRVITLSEEIGGRAGMSMECVANGAMQGLQSSLRQELAGMQWSHVHWTWDDGEDCIKNAENTLEQLPQYFEAITEDVVLGVHPYKTYKAVPPWCRRLEIARKISSQKYKDKLAHIMQV